MYGYKKTIGIVGFLLLIFGYLFTVNWSIYYRISSPGLTASDKQHLYIINPENDSGPGVMYSAIGDSLTSGVGVSDYSLSYPFLLAKSIAGISTKVTHRNFSYPGAKTDDVIRDLLEGAIASNPDVVTILLGTNDVHDGMSEEKFRENYKSIVRDLKGKTNAKIFVISIPYIGTNSLLLPPYNWFFHHRINHFNEIIWDIANEYNVEYIDLTSPTQKLLEQTGNYYSADNFHPSSVGYNHWSEIIYANFSR